MFWYENLDDLMFAVLGLLLSLVVLLLSHLMKLDDGLLK